ncbi:MAG: hypothetical protein EOP22_13635 [Hyphomicrobiales bacterium]|nr:MAG: hypothetical protein EOP22_13635 [Hyphomicrobiales bacterium]
MSDDATIRARKTIRDALILAGAMLVGTLALTVANKALGWIDSDTTTRGVMVLIGLMLVVTGNGMPKKQEGPPSQTIGDLATRQAILRVGGWAMLLGGLVWIALWIFAPRDIATSGSVAAVAASVVVMVGYSIWRYRRDRSSLS